LDNPDISKIFL